MKVKMEENMEKKMNTETESAEEKEGARLVARAGNFIIETVSDDGERMVRVRTLSSDWSVMFRHDTESYGRVMAMAADPACEESLRFLAMYLYHSTTMVMDAEYAADFVAAAGRLHDRMVTRNMRGPDPGEEDNALLEAELTEGESDYLRQGFD